jgi:hypothetical protein
MKPNPEIQLSVAQAEQEIGGWVGYKSFDVKLGMQIARIYDDQVSRNLLGLMHLLLWRPAANQVFRQFRVQVEEQIQRLQ